MAELNVRPMTGAEFAAFRKRAVAGYAAAHVAAGNWSLAEAGRRSRESFAELLPAGLDTSGMLFLVAEDPGLGVVGSVWVALESPHGPGGWIYDIEVANEHRGRGYGRALLAAAEHGARRRGVETIGLNVFGTNQVARRLYESADYEVTSLYMRKNLG